MAVTVNLEINNESEKTKTGPLDHSTAQRGVP